MAKRKSKEKPEATAPVVRREMTPAEEVRHEGYMVRKEATPSALKVPVGGKPATAPHGIFGSALMAATGTVDSDAGTKLISRAADAASPAGQEKSDEHLNAVIAMMTDIAPNDGLEGMLAAQMVACHNAAMECMRRAYIDSQTFEGCKLNLTFADRFMRTFTAQVEALAKYRGKGQQKMTVEHVHVHKGGQAIVGNVTQGGGGHGAGNDGTTSSQRAIEATGESLTLRSADGEEVWCEVQEHGEALPAAGHAERAL